MLTKTFFFLLNFLLVITLSLKAYAEEPLNSLFPLANYDQTIAHWINPQNTNYEQSLLTAAAQQKRLNVFIDHYFGNTSPWHADYVTRILKETRPSLKTTEESIINFYNNKGKKEEEIGYGANFRAYDDTWIQTIINNVNLPRFDQLVYQVNNRAIAIENLHARALPTEDVFLYNSKFAGQGFPFDMLQMSAIWIGTPLYIITETKDHAWMLVITPDLIGWVKSSGVARADKNFINTWTTSAKNKLAAISATNTSLLDEKGHFLTSAYIGSVFPATSYSSREIKILVPTSDQDHQAFINSAIVSDQQAVLMPLQPSPHHFAMIMNTLIGRPYGWGSLYFYNDCSQELKSLLTPFGIWVPRHSSELVKAGKIIDMTAASADKRLAYLMENGHPFLTMIYIGGHVIMYVGNFQDAKHQTKMAMTYQNIWGLSPKPPIRRAIIGKAVLFPMLLQYEEDPSLSSLADKKFFQISYLDQLPAEALTFKASSKIDISSLMLPTLLDNA